MLHHRRILIVSLLIFFFPQAGWTEGLREKLNRYLKTGSILVANDRTILYSQNANQLLVPASILKLATALTALHQLGKGYHYQTKFYLSRQNDLTLQGSGDPQLVSEEWATMAQALSEQANFPKNLKNLYLDDSFFGSPIQIPGVENSLNPYDALNGALVANFNTIYVEIDKNGNVSSAEQQTPLIPIAHQLAQGLSKGKHRINISRQTQYILPYVGGLFQAFLQEKGIQVSGVIKPRAVHNEDRLIYTHHNLRLLTETIESMMLYSNNFIANQLFLTVGIQASGPPARLEQSVKVMRRFLETELKIPANQFQLVEGSGISRKNQFTAHAILKLLKAFLPYRPLLAKHKGVRLKTGTLRGVYTMAGYLPHQHQNLYFVIMLNQKRNYRDKILSLLRKEFL